MPNGKTDQLFDLVNSLTKAEKRNFRLYVGRLQSNEDVQFVRLFDLLDKRKEYDDPYLIEKLELSSKGQLANLKRHLYNQLLKSLRLLHIEREGEIQIREQIDYARILYEKGLFLQARRLLERAETRAGKFQHDLLQLEIVEFIKYIEERHITRSRKVKGKMESLLQKADMLEKRTSNIIRLTNLKIRIHGLYITMGHARNIRDHWVVTEYFHSELEKVEQHGLTPMEQIFLHQSYMWYYYILLDYEQCHSHAVQWVDCFEANPQFKSRDPVLYMRGRSYVLATLFSMRRYAAYERELERFEAFSREYSGKFSVAQQIIHFMYLSTGRLNSHILQGTYAGGIELIGSIDGQMRRYAHHVDVHRTMVFNYKIAWLFFAAEQFGRSIEYLNSIIQTEAGHLREDIQCYARLMHLMAHYELGHLELLPHLIDSVTRYFNKMQDLNDVQLAILNFFRMSLNQRPDSVSRSLERLRKELGALSKDPYEQRAFQHLDILLWLDSKVSGRTMQQVARQRRMEGAGAQS